MGVLRSIRSVLSLLAVLAFWALIGAPWLYLVVTPLAILRPSRRRALVSWFMKGICRATLAGFRLGGARFEWTGTVPSAQPVLILMNHQSLLDIVVATLMVDPIAPAFVPRLRYSRFVPMVSRSIHLLGCPIVDPKRDPRGAIETIRQAARDEPHALLIYPEGHRTRDGQIRPFRAAGLQAILEARRLPVYLLVTDGYWVTRRLVDFVFNVRSLHGTTVALGPFHPPERAEEIPAAIEGWRERMLATLREMRAGQARRGA